VVLDAYLSLGIQIGSKATYPDDDKNDEA